MTSSTAAESKSAQFIELLKNRRTYYALDKNSPISDTRIQEIIHDVILHVPSSFNSQSSRIILLLGEEHNKLWDITKEVLRATVPAERFEPTEKKMDMFKGGYGTVLFFIDRPSVAKFQEKFPTYADKFPIFAQQSDAMHQYAVWTALETEGIGANLQHYNPLIDSKVAAQWDIPQEWELQAQMVFGTPTGAPNEKEFLDVEGKRFRVYGA